MNVINQHFTNIGTAFSLSIISSRVQNHNRQGGNKFSFTEISVHDELKAISNSRASGLDGISTKLIKYD